MKANIEIQGMNENTMYAMRQSNMMNTYYNVSEEIYWWYLQRGGAYESFYYYY